MSIILPHDKLKLDYIVLKFEGLSYYNSTEPILDLRVTSSVCIFITFHAEFK